MTCSVPNYKRGTVVAKDAWNFERRNQRIRGIIVFSEINKKASMAVSWGISEIIITDS